MPNEAFEALISGRSLPADELKSHLEERVANPALDLGKVNLHIGPVDPEYPGYLTVIAIRPGEFDLEKKFLLCSQLAIGAVRCRYEIVSLLDGTPRTSMILRFRNH